ncbi:MAG: hypothetical protein PVH50_07660 [Anaerolineae bacterium]|jgi:hypothetical protein
MERRRDYVAYLLRFWQVGGEDGVAWRASLESAGTGERVGFASLDDLFRYLERETCHGTLDETQPGAGGEGEAGGARIG